MKIIIGALVLIFFAGGVSAQVTVNIDSTVTYQTIEGWGAGGGIFGSLNYSIPLPLGDSINDQYLDYIANDLGLTGSRVWEVGPRIDGTGMDNGDCDSIDWSKFQANALDTSVAKYTVYFKNLVAAEGYKTSFYSSPTYPTFATMFKPWVMNDPGERAQQIWADALWWKSLGIDINYDVIQNEPNGSWTSQILADDVKALGPRLLKLGLATKTQYAEAVAPQTDWGFITPVRNDAQLWKYVGRISYHNYGTADPYRDSLHVFADKLGVTTAQTEMGNPTIDDIFNDLLLGGVSYWEVAFSGSATLNPTAGNTGWTPTGTYFRMRQVLHYVRPGSVRISATSSDSLVRVVSFKQNGKVTTAFINNRGKESVNISGLPPGDYCISQSPSGTKAFQEIGVQTVGVSGQLMLSLGASGTATTVYPRPAATYKPTIMAYGISPGYIVAPVATATLSANANDAELLPLTYAWSIVSEPSGANAVLVNPAKASTAVSGLSVAGMYVFTVSVSNGTTSSSRKVYLQVFSENPPPMMGQAGFRFNAPYGLVFTNPGDTTHANIELPLSQGILQVGIGDLANDNFTGRGKWTLVSQPPGASVLLDTTVYIYISIRANVSNMTVPGDYVFQCNVTNPGHPDLVCQVICTVHTASSGPVINSISAIPATLTTAQASSQLSATTSDPQGQLLRHWWAVKSIPAGVYADDLLFDHQGLPNSSISGLTVPGTYVFTLRTFDDIHETMKDVTVTVEKAAPDSITSTPTSLDFGILVHPDSASLSFVYRNSSHESAEITSAKIEGAQASDFTIVSNTKGVSLPYDSLVSGDSIGFTIMFKTSVPARTSIAEFVIGFDKDSSSLVALFGASKDTASKDTTSKDTTFANIVEALPLVPQVILIPNPTTGILTISGAPENVQHIVVENLLGETVLDVANPHSSEITLDLSNELAGTYFVRFDTLDGIVMRKIIRQ